MIHKFYGPGKDGNKKKSPTGTGKRVAGVLNARATAESNLSNTNLLQKFGVPKGGQTNYKNKVWEAVMVGKDSTTISRKGESQSFKISNLQLAKQNKYGTTYQLTGKKETQAEKIARLGGK
jgi:flagellar basal body P-ring protein FlgI